MASYSNTNYTNDYFDTTGYFNPTSQTSSNIDIDELDTRYLQKSGGTISNNLLVNGSVDIQTSLTIPNIGNVENAISGKQPTINANDLAITDTAGLTTALAGKQPTIEDGDLTIAKTDGLQTALNTKQPTIGDGDLTIAKTDGLQTALNAKQATIGDGDLTIAKTSGLQTALDNKYDDTGGSIDGDVNITGDLIVGTTNIITEIGTKQDEINDGDLTIAKTSGLQTALDAKQATIDEDTDLTSNSLTTNNLTINNSLNVDTRKYFDTIVLRRPTGITGEAGDFYIALRELQVWIGGSNVLQSSGLESLSPLRYVVVAGLYRTLYFRLRLRIDRTYTCVQNLRA